MILKNKKFHFDSPTRSWKIQNLISSYLRETEKWKFSLLVTNSKSKTNILHLKLLAPSQEIKSFTSSF